MDKISNIYINEIEENILGTIFANSKKNPLFSP